MKQSRIFYFTNIAPHYREEIWKLLATQPNWEFNFVFGDNYAQSKIAQIDTSQDWIKLQHFKVKNSSFKGVLFWQKGALRLAFSCKMDVAILLGEMQILSNWFLAVILRIRGVKVFFWGHGFSGNEGRFKKRIRIIFNSIAHEHFLYGQRSKLIMRSLGFNEDTLHVVNNALSYSLQHKLRIGRKKSEKFPFFQNKTLPVLVFIGRLSPVKRLDVLLDAFDILNGHNPKYNLLLIGDGSERNFLESQVFEKGNNGNIHFFGSSYNEETNAKLLANADLCVSPGNIGLTAIHCMSYGTPCATHNDFPLQMPEFESIEEGVTGFFFKKHNVKDLAMKIDFWFKVNGSNRELIRQNCYQIVDKYYNPEFQLRKFKQVILGH